MVDDAVHVIGDMVSAGGPSHEEWPQLTHLFSNLHQTLSPQDGGATRDLRRIRHAFGDALSPDTIQGHCYSKPYGYPGDFSIIDKIHTRHLSDDGRFRTWDEYMQAQPATCAVRNRGLYFEDLLRRLPRGARVLNLGCGGCRELSNLRLRDELHVRVDCVDHDPRALAFARKLVDDANVNYERADVIRWKPIQTYDLNWSAGLIEYMKNAEFVIMQKRQRPCLTPDGELVVGNFSTNNPTRPYMEIVGDWHLHHRSDAALLSLAGRAGIPLALTRVAAEAEGVNLLLHAQAGPSARPVSAARDA